MEDIAVVVIFAACVCLLVFAYLATSVRCSLWCRKGMKTDFSESSKEDLTFSAVTILSANGLSIDDLKPVDLTKSEVVVNDNSTMDGTYYCVSIDICPEKDFDNLVDSTSIKVL